MYFALQDWKISPHAHDIEYRRSHRFHKIIHLFSFGQGWPGSPLCGAQMGGVLRIPQDMIWHHPSIREKYICPELDRYHFGVHLNNNSPQPSTNALAVFLVVAVYFD
jgi:hypothetical protein